MSNSDSITGERTCKTCGAAKPMTAFKPDPTCSNGYRHTCLECFRAGQRQRHALGKDDSDYMERLTATRRQHDLKRKYGISPDEYKALLHQQNGECLICGSTGGSRRLAVDHCHSTGLVRGLLCTSCNQGLGFFKDEISLLRRAIDYVGAAR
jgi:hypothetical protein